MLSWKKNWPALRLWKFIWIDFYFRIILYIFFFKQKILYLVEDREIELSMNKNKEAGRLNETAGETIIATVVDEKNVAINDINDENIELLQVIVGTCIVNIKLW